MPVAESPTDLKQLPLYALLAYASRCARRVSGLFHLDANHAEAKSCLSAIDAAVNITQALAAAGDVDPDVLAATEDGTVRAVIVASELQPPDERAAYAANSAYAAICAAKAALEASVASDIDEPAGRVAEAATIARDSAISADERVERAALLDWEMLQRMFLGKFPGFGEPVEAAESGILGPLFQDGNESVIFQDAKEVPDAPEGASTGNEPGAESESPVKDRRKGGTGAKGKARKEKETEQHVLDEESAELSQGMEELKQQSEALKLQRDQLRQDVEQAAADRARILSEADAVRTQVDEDRRQLDVQRQEVAATSEIVRASQQQLETGQQQLERDRDQISKDWENLKVHVEELAAEREQLNADKRNFEAERDAILAESARVREVDAKIAERERHATEAVAGLHADRERFEAASSERSAALTAQETAQAEREAALVEKETALEAEREEHATTHAEMLRLLDAERTQLRDFFESLQNERREFLEERLRWKP